jgi:hypothetical protein
MQQSQVTMLVVASTTATSTATATAAAAATTTTVQCCQSDRCYLTHLLSSLAFETLQNFALLLQLIELSLVVFDVELGHLVQEAELLGVALLFKQLLLQVVVVLSQCTSLIGQARDL